MSRLFMGTVLFVFASELLGGCAQTGAAASCESTDGKPPMASLPKPPDPPVPSDATSQHATEVMRQNTDTAEHLIPYADLSVYPDNWPEITRRRADPK